MQFDILTLFPESTASYLESSIIGRAQASKKISIRLHNFRDHTTDKHHTVDDKPYGGGPGMILKIEPLYRCLKKIRRKKKSRVVLLTPGGQLFTQQVAERFAKLDQLILICGHYEGFDHRIIKLVDEALSVGPYVLTGGELPALTILDATTRLVKGVLGNDASAADESYTGSLDYVEYPQYTRPEMFKPRKGESWNVPPILLSGNHKTISEWRTKHATRKPL